MTQDMETGEKKKVADQVVGMLADVGVKHFRQKILN